MGQKLMAASLWRPKVVKSSKCLGFTILPALFTMFIVPKNRYLKKCHECVTIILIREVNFSDSIFLNKLLKKKSIWIWHYS